MEKFKCLQCGKCCKNYADDLESGGILLFEWEKNKLDQLAKDLGIDFEVEPISVSKVGDFYIADAFLIKKSPCPFLKNNFCLIYKDRPSSCKVFPIDAFIFLSREREFHLNFIPRCSGFDKRLIKKLEGRQEYKKTLKILKDYFGKEIVLLSLQRGKTTSKLLDIMDRIGVEEKSDYNKFSEEEKKNLIIMPLFTFCKKNNILSKSEIKNIIKEHKVLKDVSQFSNLLDEL